MRPELSGSPLNELALSLGSLIVGIVATVLVSAYYFRKSVRKSLTPYVQFYSSPFKGIDPAVKKALQVTYLGTPVDELYEVQFLIANTGDKAIRDLIEPLTFSVPEKCSLLDASLLHLDPPELKIELIVSEDRQDVKLSFPLLNSNDFFVLKVLLNGTPKFNELKFSILVDELPPTLKPERLNFDAVGTSRKRKVEFSLLAGGLITALLGLVLFKVIYDGWVVLPKIEGDALTYLSQLGLGGVAIYIATAPAFMLTLFGLLMVAEAMFDGKLLPSKKKFVLPEGLAKSHLSFTVRGSDAES
jgi:hypothetical protein